MMRMWFGAWKLKCIVKQFKRLNNETVKDTLCNPSFPSSIFGGLYACKNDK